MNNREFKFTLPTGQQFTGTPGQPFTIPADIASTLNEQIKNKLSTSEAPTSTTPSTPLTPDIKVESPTADGKEAPEINIMKSSPEEIITELNKFPTTNEKFNWLKEKGFIEPIKIEGGVYDIINHHDKATDVNRPIVFAKVGKYNIPFYISSGDGNKKNVEAGKWYPFLGMSDKDGWFNKGYTEAQVNDHYGLEVFKKIAKILNDGIGKIRINKIMAVEFSPKNQKTIQEFNTQMNLPTQPTPSPTRAEDVKDYLAHMDSTLKLIKEESIKLEKEIAEDSSNATNLVYPHPDIKFDQQSVYEPAVEPQEPEPTTTQEQIDPYTAELMQFIKERNENKKVLDRLIALRDELLEKIEQQKKELAEEHKKNQEELRSKIQEDIKNKQENKTEKIPTATLEKEIKKNMKALLSQIKEKEPSILDFKFRSNKKGFVLDTTIKINKTGNMFFRTATIDLKIPLVNNNNGELSVGEPTIEAGVATSTATKMIQPQLSQLVPLIKSYFENEYKKQIQSMSYEEDNLVLTFKE